MKWFVKCMAFQVLARIPGGQSLYHAAQRRLTGSTRQTESRLLGKIEQTLKYWQWLEPNLPPVQPAAAVHLELGSGWLPSVPITLHALGITRQYLVDISPHMTSDAVVDTAEIFRAVAPRAGVKFARMPVVPARGQSLAATLEPFGMVYAAPYDELARNIAGQVDFITATQMLYHLDLATLQTVCGIVHRLLKPGGCFLAQQHLRQPIDGLDSRISPFYSLRYSEWFWEKFVKSPMVWYNRLKPRDYRQVLEQAGFVLAHFEVEPGQPEDFALLDRAKIHPMFARYTRDELAARALFFVAQKPCLIR
jgi:SAM-dependent methyltransferase